VSLLVDLNSSIIRLIAAYASILVYAVSYMYLPNKHTKTKWHVVSYLSICFAELLCR